MCIRDRLLTAGKLSRKTVTLVEKPYFFQKLFCLGNGVLFCSLLHLKRRQDHIFQDRLVWKKLVALKYHPDLLADPGDILRLSVDGLASECNASLLYRL